jgi:hypothetical protein
MSNVESGDARRSRARLMSVDFWRGFALITIFINHIPGNAFVWLTHRNYGFSDATEIFVMLAGVGAALAYLPRFRQGEAAATSFRIVQRAFQLYTIHIMLIVCCGALIAYAVTVTGDTRFFEAFRLDVLVNDTIPGLIGLATLMLQPSYLDILPLYVVLLLMSPLLLVLTARNVWLGLGASAALYLTAQLVPVQLSTFPAEGLWFLNPLCWQLLFTIGLAIGGMILNGDGVRSRVLFWAAAVYVAASAVWIVSGFNPTWNLSPVPVFAWEFSKSDLHLPRLLHVLALTYVVSHLPLERWIRQTRLLGSVAVLGRHSLPVFALGTVLAVAGQLLRALSGGGLLVDIGLIGSGLAMLFACAGVLEWNRREQEDRRHAIGPAASAH